MFADFFDEATSHDPPPYQFALQTCMRLANTTPFLDDATTPARSRESLDVVTTSIETTVCVLEHQLSHACYRCVRGGRVAMWRGDARETERWFV